MQRAGLYISVIVRGGILSLIDVFWTFFEGKAVVSASSTVILLEDSIERPGYVLDVIYSLKVVDVTLVVQILNLLVVHASREANGVEQLCPLHSRLVVRQERVTEIRSFLVFLPDEGIESMLDVEEERQLIRRAVMLSKDKATIRLQHSVDLCDIVLDITDVVQDHETGDEVDGIVLVREGVAIIVLECEAGRDIIGQVSNITTMDVAGGEMEVLTYGDGCLSIAAADIQIVMDGSIVWDQFCELVVEALLSSYTSFLRLKFLLYE